MEKRKVDWAKAQAFPPEKLPACECAPAREARAQCQSTMWRFVQYRTTKKSEDELYRELDAMIAEEEQLLAETDGGGVLGLADDEEITIPAID